MATEILKNSKLIVELINPEPELENEVQIMLDSGRPKEDIIRKLKQALCYFEWSVKHTLSGVKV